ncbi:type II toxin-antitoxin system prevent-host-death family antitoxin [Chloroflexi bacterium TSY]|nr:type II toxin-antitoxin system prevent-host-death family antitoxin [Chloroflexi bacterium TSY]
MNEVPQIAPVSDMHHKQSEIFAMMDKAPVILAQRSKPRAVLVSVEQWNRINAELRRARLLIKAKQIYERNNKSDSWIDFEELLTQLEERHDPEIIKQIRQGLSEHVAG